ncbi:general transcription factor IIF subunit 1 [Protopterus annectens]|uniref:general transcription factor IIF subunit 1 n=1 Tax=Protopterus annectens TaxID=7888 RepID=UPI001CFBD673|nr:general transcription factor IIF subunit 1 [Protopterus annectens]
MTALGSSSQSVTEYVVRVPKNTTKKYNIMAFNAGDRVNFASWTQAKMERDLSNKKIYQDEEVPETGAGSEFGRKQREEARRKKFGIITKEFRVEDQPWILRVNGKAGRKFKGVKKGGVNENASYYIFTQCPDGAFEAFPVNNWYNFTPIAKHRTLTAEEAEEEWGRYSEEEEPKLKTVNKEEVPQGIDEDNESSEESEEEKPNEEKEEEDEEKKAAPQADKKKKKEKHGEDSSDESESSEESDIENETTSALFMTKKKTPPKKDRKGSTSSSRASSRPGTPPVDGSLTSSTLRAAASKLEQGKRQGASGDTPTAKRLKMDTGPQTPSGKSTPQPQSGKSTPSSGDVQLTEEAVRRYLTRKPMTTKDLLKKFQTKKTGLSSEQTVNVLAQILKRLNPERKKINEKMHFFLKE